MPCRIGLRTRLPGRFVNEAHLGHAAHALAGNLALIAVLIGFTFAALLYYRRAMDPAEATRQFPGVYAFLQNKWYFDELYSAMLVRPALTVAGWCRSFDTRVIDGLVNWLGRINLAFCRVTGKFDKGIIDGLVNLVARFLTASAMDCGESKPATCEATFCSWCWPRLAFGCC